MGTQELSTVNPPASCSETLHGIQGPGDTFLKINISPMRTSLVARMVKRLPTMRETQVQSLGWEDPLEKEMATHSSTLAGKSLGQRSMVGYSPRGRKELDTFSHDIAKNSFLRLQPVSSPT